MTTNQNLGWINGQWERSQNLKIPINDRGLNFADGIFETILIFNGAPQLVDQHLLRWENSANLLGMNPPPSKEWVLALISDGINKSHLQKKNGAIRLNWSRGESIKRGIDLNNTNSHRFWIEINHYQPNFKPISTFISKTERRNSFSRLSRCKTFSYNQSIQARLEAKQAGYNDALLLNSDGNMCCSTTANILVKRESHWLTPPVSNGCLPGIMRQRGIDLNIIKEAVIKATPHNGDEWFLINSLSCRPIKNIATRKLYMSTNPEKFWLDLLKTV